MRTRIAAAALAAAALLALTACSSSDDDSKATTPSATTPAGTGSPSSPSSTEAATGDPSDVDAALIDVLHAIDPSLAADPKKTTEAADIQCATLASGGDPTGHTAATRFGDSAHPLTDAQGIAINGALTAMVCDPPF